MISPYLYSLVSVIAVGLVSLVGVFVLSLEEKFLKKYIFFFISLAVGALMGDAFIHLIPESIEVFQAPGVVGILVIAGIIGFLILEKYIHWHHHGEDESKPHAVGKLVLFSDGVHNVTDGVAIGVSFLISVPLGIATTIAVILHEIPQEIGDFSVLLHSGYTRSRALWFNFLSALTAILGLFIAWILGQAGQGFMAWILPVTAGGFIYIAIADLIPELHKTKELKHSFLQIIGLLIGVLAMFLLLFFE